MTFTYNGATAASTLANPPILVWSPTGGAQGPVNSNGFASAKIWFWSSTNVYTDLYSSTAGLITDGYDIGMRAGDLCMGVCGASTAGSTQSIPFMAMVAYSASGVGAGFSTGVLVSS